MMSPCWFIPDYVFHKLSHASQKDKGQTTPGLVKGISPKHHCGLDTVCRTWRPGDKMAPPLVARCVLVHRGKEAEECGRTASGAVSSFSGRTLASCSGARLSLGKEWRGLERVIPAQLPNENICLLRTDCKTARY